VEDLRQDGDIVSDNSNDVDFIPSVNERICGIPDCIEDIFLGCENCVLFLCFDHMSTECSAHPRLLSDNPHLDNDSLSEMSSTEENKPQKRKLSSTNDPQCKTRKDVGELTI